MYMSVKDLRYLPIRAKDGQIGFLEQVFFDDEKRAIRYLVVDADQHLEDKRVLISPIAVEGLDVTSNSLLVRLTREQVLHSPDIDTEKPVSRQKELEYNLYYGFATYWGGPGLWGPAPLPRGLFSARAAADKTPRQESGDPHLRSSREVIGYRVQAADGRIGHIEDFIFDLADWSIQFIEVDARNWIGGKKVLVDPRWVQRVNWPERKVHLDLFLEAIKSAPPFESLAGLTPEYALKLGEHYGFPPPQ
jgi:sporulation protein YlmC with PRC-barrel domain